MIDIIKQEITIDNDLKKKLEFICSFCNTTLTIQNGSIRKIDKTNLTYVEPHKIFINNITFLAFNYSNDETLVRIFPLEEYRNKLIKDKLKFVIISINNNLKVNLENNEAVFKGIPTCSKDNNYCDVKSVE